MKRGLLVMACGMRKIPYAYPVPAIELYDGTTHRILRRALLQYHYDNLTILFLSAKYGLISGRRKIESYDQKMTPERADELKDSVSRELRAISFDRFYVDVGPVYARAIPSFLPIEINPSRYLDRLRRLKEWLEEQRDKQESSSRLGVFS